MKSPAVRTLLVACALVTVLVASPALAADRGLVINDCYAYGHQLQGMAETEALAAIIASATVPAFPPITVVVGTRTWSLPTPDTLRVDVVSMLDSAYATTTPPGTEIAPVYAVRGTYLTDWVSRVGASLYLPARNAKYVFGRRGISVDSGQTGRKLDRSAVIADLRSRVESIAASGDVVSTPETAVYQRVAIPQKVRKADLGKAIGVDLSERRIRLYSRGKVVRRYRCAVGTASHPTPRGTFKVYAKVKWPTWRNPGSAWAVNMPAYIGPGPSNPLGTRALYLTAPGIRIHGTSQRASIGTAASHGCMRMLREDVEALYPLVPVGTKVHIVR